LTILILFCLFPMDRVPVGANINDEILSLKVYEVLWARWILPVTSSSGL
jgi:hypothetical protein